MTVKELFQLTDFKKITAELADDDWELNNDKTKTRDEIKETKKINSDYIYECFLEMMQTDPVVDNQKIVFCSWYTDLKYPECSYMNTSLLEINDIMTKSIPYIDRGTQSGEPFSFEEYAEKYIQKYAFEFEPWEEILGYHVADASISRYGIEKVSKAIYDEMTFFGFKMDKSESKAQEELEVILKNAEEVRQNPQSCIPAEEVFRDLRKEFKITPPTEEEMNQRRKQMIEENRINQEEENLILKEIQKEYQK